MFERVRGRARTDPLELPPDEIEANRERWVDEWTRHRRSLSAARLAGRRRTACRSRSSALFFVYPLARHHRARAASGRQSRRVDVLSDPLTRDVVWFTLWQAARVDRADARSSRSPRPTSSAATIPGTQRSSSRSSSSRSCCPTVVVALAFLAILPDGIERGWAPILIAHAFFNVAVVVRIVGTFWANLDPRVAEAAATLGAAPWRAFREITLPLLAPALAAAAAIVFLFSFTSFGDRPHPRRRRAHATLEAEIYNQAVRLFDLRAAAVLSLVQLACVVATVLGRDAARAPTARRPGRCAPERRRSAGRGRRASRLVVGRSLGGLALFLGLPLAVLVERSLAAGGGHGLDATARSADRRACSSSRRGRRS